MKQQVWSSPKTAFEEFVPQVYCANCSGDDYHGTTYYFECNAGVLGSSYNVYFEDGTPYASSHDDEELSAEFTGYHPCGEKHTAPNNSGFYKGYMYKQTSGFLGIGGGQNTGDRIDVIIWTENNTDVHCTKNLNMKDWEIAKS